MWNMEKYLYAQCLVTANDEYANLVSTYISDILNKAVKCGLVSVVGNLLKKQIQSTWELLKVWKYHVLYIFEISP